MLRLECTLLPSTSSSPVRADNDDFMRLSRYFLPILRETPKEAEIVSHR